MYSLIEAEKLTGISEGGMKLYLESGIISNPLSDTDIAKLEDLKWLKSHGVLGLDELKAYLTHPSWNPGSPEVCYEKIRTEMNLKKEESEHRYSIIYKIAGVAILAILAVILYSAFGTGGVLILVGFGAAGLTGFYCSDADAVKKMAAESRKMQCRVSGTVTELKEEHGFDIGLIRTGGDDMSITGRHSSIWWTFLMELFGQLRTDCWYAVIEFRSNDGSICKGMLNLAGRKDTWNVGDSIEAVWNGSNPCTLYPADESSYGNRRKADTVKMVLTASIALGLIVLGGMLIFGSMQ